MPTVPTPSRGEIWLVNFDPSVGAEIGKRRPALVVSIQSVGKLALRLVVPITDWKPVYATYSWLVHLPVTTANRLMKESGADAFQVKSVSLDRFDRKLGDVTDDQMEE